MRNKKESLLNALKKQCTKRVRICTMKFCAVGCIVEDYDDEDDFPGGIRMDDGSIMTDDDDFLEEFGEDVL